MNFNRIYFTILLSLVFSTLAAILWIGCNQHLVIPSKKNMGQRIWPQKQQQQRKKPQPQQQRHRQQQMHIKRRQQQQQQKGQRPQQQQQQHRPCNLWVLNPGKLGNNLFQYATSMLASKAQPRFKPCFLEVTGRLKSVPKVCAPFWPLSFNASSLTLRGFRACFPTSIGGWREGRSRYCRGSGRESSTT